ncbi:DJ-1/PfpI family protein [Parasphingorhabdus cellanae]|uniref:DJ-1/PfpI family protein n=1 Tax=Parasphingorhabdus cellanae TaxID=2806553 RepID=A0ABX7T4Y2_9SPHN|nr:DJ-1/PfpI family protein [Parasphingorhabdus cellanae]QTD55822.1 DJ-1/PfpI family protein [Parasphingorhabdus cellanae]
MTNEIDRRQVMSLSAMLAAGAALPAQAATTEMKETKEEHMRKMRAIPKDAPKVSMLVYPKMVALDLIGPMTVFNILRCNIELVWKDTKPVTTDLRIPMAPTHSFADANRDPDVLFVPGGIIGTTACMEDPEVCDFVADLGSRADWVTSVCTGSLVLGAAGLLDGYDATSYWAVAELLPLFGARHVNQRIVQDRNRFTGGGVTAGIDFGLALAAKLKDEEAAKRIQLIIEYTPQPPFKNGSPEEAGPERTASMRKSRQGMDAAARVAAENAAARLKLS